MLIEENKFSGGCLSLVDDLITIKFEREKFLELKLNKIISKNHSPFSANYIRTSDFSHSHIIRVGESEGNPKAKFKYSII